MGNLVLMNGRINRIPSRKKVEWLMREYSLYGEECFDEEVSGLFPDEITTIKLCLAGF